MSMIARRGFTVFEFFFLLCVIGLLAGLLIPSYLKMSRDIETGRRNSITVVTDSHQRPVADGDFITVFNERVEVAGETNIPRLLKPQTVYLVRITDPAPPTKFELQTKDGAQIALSIDELRQQSSLFMVMVTPKPTNQDMEKSTVGSAYNSKYNEFWSVDPVNHNP